ncbi:MAG: DUF1501 domain-containing protein, partial [Planctomycetota bacterium]
MHPLLARRGFLGSLLWGGSQLGLLGLLEADGQLRAGDQTAGGGEERQPHFRPRAKNLLVVFASGACSHLDSWDYKPELIKRDGQPMPGEGLITFQGENGNLTRSPYDFTPRGESGKMVSSLFPRLGDLADEICFLHAMTSRTNTHGPG